MRAVCLNASLSRQTGCLYAAVVGAYNVLVMAIVVFDNEMINPFKLTLFVIIETEERKRVNCFAWLFIE